jgi:hypothetical protein
MGSIILFLYMHILHSDNIQPPITCSFPLSHSFCHPPKQSLFYIHIIYYFLGLNSAYVCLGLAYFKLYPFSWKWHNFILCGGHLSWFYSLVIVNSTAINMSVQASLLYADLHSSRYIFSSVKAGSYGSSVCTYLRSLHTDFHSDYSHELYSHQ